MSASSSTTSTLSASIYHQSLSRPSKKFGSGRKVAASSKSAGRLDPRGGSWGRAQALAVQDRVGGLQGGGQRQVLALEPARGPALVVDDPCPPAAKGQAHGRRHAHELAVLGLEHRPLAVSEAALQVLA